MQAKVAITISPSPFPNFSKAARRTCQVKTGTEPGPTIIAVKNRSHRLTFSTSNLFTFYSLAVCPSLYPLNFLTSQLLNFFFSAFRIQILLTFPTSQLLSFRLPHSAFRLQDIPTCEFKFLPPSHPLIFPASYLLFFRLPPSAFSLFPPSHLLTFSTSHLLLSPCLSSFSTESWSSPFAPLHCFDF